MEWTSKYRPTSIGEVRGNTDAITELQNWAENWSADEPAVILHGVPGIGKTTAAHALANDMSWQSMEMNASEQRTKDVVNRVAGGAANMGTLTQGASGKRLVILDEADSLHGNVDRGGSSAMTSIVKDAQQPVVLIANDFYEMSNTLRNSCKAIEFELVDQTRIESLLRDISNEEDIDCTDTAIETIAEKADGDVRAAVNDLQAVGSHGDETITVEDLPTQTRDREENIFPFMDAVLKEDNPLEAKKKARQVDETPDTLFQWIEDNIVQEYSPEELSTAYTALSRADKWLGRVYSSDHNYKYWRYANDQMTAGVAASRNGYHGGWTRWSPPSLWRKLGSTRGTRNTRNAISEELVSELVISINTAKTSVLPFVESMTHHCKPRDLTTDIVSVYGFDESQLAFITGSGENTNKVEDIVSEASERRLNEASKHIDESESSSGSTDEDNSLSQSTDAGTSTDNHTDTQTDTTTETDGEQTTLF